MKSLKHTYSFHFKDKVFLRSFISSFVILIVALIISFYANVYATKVASQPVTDIILSNIRVYDVDWIFVYGFWIFCIFITVLGILKPYRVPFAVKSIALFVIIRAVFISLTHIGPFPGQDLLSTSKFVTDFTSGRDLFFSSHTGLPFLLALMFWNHKPLRWLFIAISIFFGAIVLMGHLHYSIDVLAAPFITYTIYHMAGVIFKKDKEMFENGIRVRN